MSSVGGCDRANLGVARGLIPFSGGFSLPAREGSLHEYDLVTRLRDKGYVIINALDDQKPVACGEWKETGAPLLVGHPDGQIFIDDGRPYLLEIKSKDLGRYAWLSKGDVQKMFPTEYVQVQLYMTATGLDNCLYICKNRTSGKLYEEIIRHDDKFLDRFLAERLNPVIKAVENPEIPISDFSCHEHPDVRKWCPLGYMCDEGALDPVVKDEPELIEAIQQWRRVKELTEEADTLNASLRKKLKKYLTDVAEKKVFIDGVPVQIVQGTRTGWNKPYLEEVLTDEEMREARTATPFEQLRIG